MVVVISREERGTCWRARSWRVEMRCRGMEAVRVWIIKKSRRTVWMVGRVAASFISREQEEKKEGGGEKTYSARLASGGRPNV